MRITVSGQHCVELEHELDDEQHFLGFLQQVLEELDDEEHEEELDDGQHLLRTVEHEELEEELEHEELDDDGQHFLGFLQHFVDELDEHEESHGLSQG